MNEMNVSLFAINIKNIKILTCDYHKYLKLI